MTLKEAFSKLPGPKVLIPKYKDIGTEIEVTIEQKDLVFCKNCKYFEYDSVAKVDGIPLIVAHEICKRWCDGCKTSEDGFCFLGEAKESEEQA